MKGSKTGKNEIEHLAEAVCRKKIKDLQPLFHEFD